jgi:hypothetical protein
MADSKPPEVIGLTQAERDYVNNWIERTWMSRKCPMCDVKRWFIGTIEVVPIPVRNGAPELTEGPAYFFVPIFCMNCGNTVFLNKNVIHLDTVKPIDGK